ncbi:MAG: OmpA family protein [Byssovorax sp.]
MLRNKLGPLGAVLSCSLLLGALTGCTASPKPLAKAPSAAPGAGSDAGAHAAASSARADHSSPTAGSLHIDDRIVKACGDIPTAHFAFDSSKIDAEAAAALDALGRCFSTGPLKGHTMRLTGYADPRGELEYNMGLGQKRAGSVAAYLDRKGLDKSKVAATSKGSLEATGTDEEGWARDRKVEVTLVD